MGDQHDIVEGPPEPFTAKFSVNSSFENLVEDVEKEENGTENQCGYHTFAVSFFSVGSNKKITSGKANGSGAVERGIESGQGDVHRMNQE
tara:strand:- start:5884 stop:6153 length:270 start_codon:yes stop_codon:yes gene_type:complete